MRRLRCREVRELPFADVGASSAKRFRIYPAPPWEAPKSPSARRLELRREVADYRRDPIAYVSQCLAHWQSIPKAYLAGDLDLHVHLRFRPGDLDGNFQHLCIHFQRPSQETQANAGLSFGSAVAEAADLGLDLIRGHRDGLDHAVLVLLPKIVEVSSRASPLAAERVRVRRVLPAVTRLRPVEHCSVLLQDAFQEPVLDVCGAPVGFGLATGECGPLGDALAPQPEERQLKDEVIQSRSQVVDTVADRRRDVERRLDNGIYARPERTLGVRR